MGASGLMTLIYAITKINYTYEIPLTILATLRGAPGDKAKFHVSNGLYFLPSLDAMSLTYKVIDSTEKILDPRCLTGGCLNNVNSLPSGLPIFGKSMVKRTGRDIGR